MFCPKCGAELVEGEKLCSSCGVSVGEISMKKANAGARFVSYTIDQFIVGFVNAFIELSAVFFGMIVV